MSAEWACLQLAQSGRSVARTRRARSLCERFRGLMLAPPLVPGEALWLPACNAVHTAFLRGPIDLLFLRGEIILRAVSAVAPWRIAVGAGADSVVELAAGEIVRLGLMPGQRLEARPDPGILARAS